MMKFFNRTVLVVSLLSLIWNGTHWESCTRPVSNGQLKQSLIVSEALVVSLSNWDALWRSSIKVLPMVFDQDLDSPYSSQRRTN